MNEPATTTEPAEQVIDSFDSMLRLCAADMAEVDRCIRASLHSDVVLINQVSEYIIGGGGKRLRPMLVVQSARACDYDGLQHIPLAAIIEFIHTATLLHDDVVDESDMRRGRETAHAVWGNAASVLVGDFLYSRSFQMMVELGSMRIMKILSETTNTIAEGEVLQLLNLGDPEVDELRYLQVIRNKTARLFQAACQLGAVLAGAGSEAESALARFGNHLGCAFQITDDVLDFVGDDNDMGKQIGDDLAEGKPTLPLILARQRCSPAESAIIDDAIRNGGLNQLDAILQIIDSTDSLDSARQQAQREAQTAMESLSVLPQSSWRSALETLAEYSIQRSG